MQVSRSAIANGVSIFSAFFSMLPVSCCVFPVALSFLGASGLAFASSLMPYRPYFIELNLDFIRDRFLFHLSSAKRLCTGCGLCNTESSKGTNDRLLGGHCICNNPAGIPLPDSILAPVTE